MYELYFILLLFLLTLIIFFIIACPGVAKIMIIARKLTKERNTFYARAEYAKGTSTRNHIRFLCDVVLSQPADWYIVALYPGDQVYHHGQAYHAVYNLITKDEHLNCHGFNISIGVKWALLKDCKQYAKQATPAHQGADGTNKKCSRTVFAAQIGLVLFDIIFVFMLNF
jgi:hypothetical protein